MPCMYKHMQTTLVSPNVTCYTSTFFHFHFCSFNRVVITFTDGTD